MTQISRDTVLHLASLSGLTLTDEEIDALQQDLQKIIGYINQLDELDTKGVEPTYQVTGLKNVYRDDRVDATSMSREALLQLAPDSEQHQIKVPKVL